MSDNITIPLKLFIELIADSRQHDMPVDIDEIADRDDIIEEIQAQLNAADINGYTPLQALGFD